MLEYLPFQLACDVFTYLGILTSPNLDGLIKLNVQPAETKVKNNLQRKDGRACQFL